MKKINRFFDFLQITLITSFIIIVGGYLILIANGYKINFQAKKIQKTGMIYLRSNPKEVNIYINGKFTTDKTPARLADLSPGRYDVKISKEGYYDWQKTEFVESGLVSAENNIILFLINPLSLPINEDEKDAFQQLPNRLLNTNLEVRDSSEIWLKSIDNKEQTLVTRLSQAIKKVASYSDKNYILYQIENEIHVIYIDGSNDRKLIQLSSNQPSEFFVDDKGEILYYQDNEQVKKVKIH